MVAWVTLLWEIYGSPTVFSRHLKNKRKVDLMKKIRALSPDLELSTPTESRQTTGRLGGQSPSVKLMSCIENKALAKTNL